MKTSKKRTQSRVNAFVRCDRRTFRFHACSRHVVRAAIPSADFLHLARRTQRRRASLAAKRSKIGARAPESDKKIPHAKRAKTRWRFKTYPSEFDRGLYRHERANRELFPLYITFMHVNDVFFVRRSLLYLSLVSCWSFALFAFFRPDCFNFFSSFAFCFFFSLAVSKKKTIRSSLEHSARSNINKHTNNKNAIWRTTTPRTAPRRRRKRSFRFVSVEVRCRVGNGTSSSSS